MLASGPTPAAGRANLAEYRATGSGGEFELLALRWFNPATREWNIDFATPKVGMLGAPGVGVFKDGRADFYDHEPIDGRSVMVRFSIWGSAALSDDGGKTWEINWIKRYSREK